MFVSRLQELIDALSSETRILNLFDTIAIEQLTQKYALLPADRELSATDLLELKALFAARWKAVFDTDNDYTFSAGNGNRAWLSLAKELSKELKTCLLRILIPVLTNNIDPDNLVNIGFIKDPCDIYLDQDGQTWHLVHALFDRLQENPGHLLVQSTIDKRSVRTLSLVELSRLQRKSPGREACFDGHTSFWSYLLSTAKRSWSHSGHLEPQLLTALSTMIDACHIRAGNPEFNITKESSWCDLNTHLKRYRLTDLRHFYGTNLSHKGQIVCLIDLLTKQPTADSNSQENLHSIWRYVIRRMARSWQEQGSLRVTLLRDLLTLFDRCYDAGEAGHLAALSDFFIKLRNHDRDDVNHFYSIQIDFGGQKHYLLDILLDGFSEREPFLEKIPPIVYWIHSCNPSLVAKSPQLDNVYLALQSGPHFSLSALQQRLDMLTVSPSSGLAQMLYDVRREAAGLHGITPVLLNHIQSLYAERWSLIMDQAEDYTRLWDGVNTAWIVLAQSLAGAGLISKNYYSFLIPSLTQTHDLVASESYISRPLTDYILSENKDRLISLNTSVQYFKSNGLFFNCSEFQPRRLTLREHWRMQFAKAEYQEIYKRCELTPANHGLSRMTVLVLKELVQSSIFADGLRLGNVSVEMLQSAYAAYQQLLDYMHQLPEVERNDWYNYRICLESQERTFLSVLKSIVYEQACIASFGKFFIKLCLDYDFKTRFTFSPRIEELAGVESKRLSSAQNHYRAPTDSSDSEAGRRLLILMVSLLTHKFSIFGSGYDIEFETFSNKVTHSGSRIFAILAHEIRDGEWRDANTIYFNILDNIVVAALNNGSKTRTSDTLSWLKSIANGQLFSRVHAHCFEPALILTALSGMLKIKATSSESSREFDLNGEIATLSDKILHQLRNKSNRLVQWVNVNAHFALFLRRMSKPLRLHILNQLRNVTEPVSMASTLDAITTLSEHCPPDRSPQFFKASSSDYSLRQRALDKQAFLESCGSVGELLTLLHPDKPGECVGSSSTSTYH
ncbi:hypothetical protein [Legionella sp. CNM-4043-24]|uniref:hypothetical protein n=1 Tax=Legionella sp. CNM-4043-24 TaxID=3421646 RepID=UPI00403B31A8